MKKLSKLSTTTFLYAPSNSRTSSGSLIDESTIKAFDRDFQTSARCVFPEAFGPNTFKPEMPLGQFGQASIHFKAVMFELDGIKSSLSNATGLPSLNVNCETLFIVLSSYHPENFYLYVFLHWKLLHHCYIKNLLNNYPIQIETAQRQ